VKGRIDTRDDKPKIVASEVAAPDLSEASRPLRIKIAATACTPDRLEELKAVLGSHPGPSPVLVHLVSGANRTTILRLGAGFTVELRNGLFAEVRSLLGTDSIVD
jgi:DNA polymerase-3 subunit alpha